MFPKSEVEWLKCMQWWEVLRTHCVAVARYPNLRKGEDYLNSPSLLNWREQQQQQKKCIFHHN